MTSPSSLPTAPRWGIIVLAVAVLGLLTAAGPTRAPSAHAVDRITWSVTPTKGAGAERVSFRYDLRPGATQKDSVTVRNFSDAPVRFTLYGSDGVITEDGQFDVLPAATKPRDVGTWITLTQNTITVPAKSQADVPFTVTVPANATPGDHPGGVVASVASGAAEQVQVESRVGVRLHLRVTGPLKPSIAISDLTLDHQGTWNPFGRGTIRVRYTVENLGNIRLGADQAITVSGPFGLASRQDRVRGDEFLPGTKHRVQRTITDVPPLLRTTAVITNTPFRVGQDVVDVALPVDVAEASVWTVPWSLLLLTMLLLIVVAFGVRARRRAQARIAAQIEAARQEGEQAARQSS